MILIFVDISNANIPGVTTTATWISQTQVLCTTPAHPAGTVPISVSPNGVQFSTPGANYSYEGMLQLAPVSLIHQ